MTRENQRENFETFKQEKEEGRKEPEDPSLHKGRLLEMMHENPLANR